MNSIGLTFLVLAGLAQWTLPRRLAVLPLLVSFAWMTRGQALEFGDVNISVLRVIIVIALARAVAIGAKPAKGINSVDVAWLLWALWLVASAAFHDDTRLVFRLGLVWEYLGAYAVLRLFIQDADDVRRLFKMMCLVLVPVAALMWVEQLTGQNPFGPLGGVSPIAQLRDNGLRASGPFAHPLLAGTVGAALVPVAVALWSQSRRLAWLAFATGLAIVMASASSAPLLMLAAAAAVLLAWRLRVYTGWIVAGTLAMLVALHFIMNDPVYFLMAKADIVGGSTGWHRAQLVRVALEQFGEWWFAGTDFTRHWMATGIPDNENHSDITNHYLAQAVLGGLPLATMLIYIIVASARTAAAAARRDDLPSGDALLAWTTLAILFSHAINFLGCALFDQSIVSFLAIVAAAAVFRQTAEIGSTVHDESTEHHPLSHPVASPFGRTA
jgi:hypothetical protein